MASPQTAFDAPQFPLIPDEAPRYYANVDNRLQMVFLDGRIFTRPVVVHTSLFTMMRDVFKVPVEDEVTLYVSEVTPERYAFGMMWGEEEFVDLWPYTKGTLPGMIKPLLV